MKFFKKLAAVLLGTAMCLSLCACDTDLETLLLMRKVGNAIEDTKSFEGEFSCSTKAAYGVLPLKLSVEGDIRCVTQPMTMEIATEIDLGLLGELEAKIYLLGTDDSMEIYAGIEDLAGDMTWTHEVLAAPGETSLDTSGLLKIIDSGSDLLTKGEERKINGVNAVRLTLTLPGDMMAVSVGNESGTMDDLIIDAWVNKSDGHIIRLETELGELAMLALAPALESEADNISITAMPLVIDINDFNCVDEIVLPQEALKAAS